MDHPNFSFPVIGVRELVCHPMNGDNPHSFQHLNPIVRVDEDEMLKTRLCGFMDKQKTKTQLREYKPDRNELSENQLNLELISTMKSLKSILSI